MEKEIIIDGLKLRYEDCGKADGKPILMMHGWGCDHTTLAWIRDSLTDGMRVINIDLPGHGQSDEPPTVWGTEDFAHFIEKLISRLGLKNPTVLGHSFGGRVGILFASKNPISKLILVDAAGIKARKSLKKVVRIYSFKCLKKFLPIITGQKTAAKLIDKYRARFGSSDYANSSPKMRAVMSRCINEDLKYAMPSIQASTLLIWGENDTATPLSDAKTMKRLIPDAGLVNFPNSGHYSFLDNPGGFRAVIREFLKTELK